jgi:hypothetical protein
LGESEVAKNRIESVGTAGAAFGTIGTEQPDNLPRVDGERDVVDRRHEP